MGFCPIYATYDELFESFMYHDPKNGAVFKQIIDEWIEKNAGVFEALKQKIANAKAKNTNSPILVDEDDDEKALGILEKRKRLPHLIIRSNANALLTHIVLVWPDRSVHVP